MENRLGLKVAAIAVLSIALLVGLLWIRSLVAERQQRRDIVVHDIAASSSTAQTLKGPVLVVPYVKTVRLWKEDTSAGNRHIEERQVSGELVLLPEEFKLNGQVPTELRKRGIYQARLYHANLQIHASFDIPARYGIGDEAELFHFGPPALALGITDIRGIQSVSKMTLNGAPLKVLAGSTSDILGPGLHAAVASMDGSQDNHLELDMELSVLGTSQFEVIPVGRASRIVLESNWPNPSFDGAYLPMQHTITTAGFQAQWNTSFFSTNLEEAMRKCVAGMPCTEVDSRTLGVSFIDPVDQYLKTDRAIKYGFLFISLTFVGFFLFEMLKKLAVHPIQYSLVGTALALFYLLLLSLSEHIGFGAAYALSSSACVLLIGFYVSGILHSARHGVGFGAMLTLLYGVLYGLLSADDYALLMGSILVFGLLAAVMVMTREVDWGSLRGRNSAAEEA
jgi:inner membrane protein